MEKAPLAWRLRPQSLEEFLGQRHLLSQGKPLRVMIEEDMVRSVVFYGPPGTGKTCLAHIIAARTQALFIGLSAVTAGKKDLLAALDKASKRWKEGQKTLLFVDEIHRFNRVQQETLLPAVEDGRIILIGASTENPYFALVPGIRSRAQVFAFEPLSQEDLVTLMKRALERYYPQVEGEAEALDLLARLSSGDGRKALNSLELAIAMAQGHTPPRITPRMVTETFQKSIPYDTQLHYDAMSAFIKSMRGSDPDATLFWLAFMLEGGEDPLYIARRILIAASEDVGLADPAALILAHAAYQGVKEIGLPEGALILAHAALYVATAPKSNRAYEGLRKAQEEVKRRGEIQVPPHLRDSSSYTKGGRYLYPHSFPQHFVEQVYMDHPVSFYEPSDEGREAKIRERLKKLWKERYG